MKQFIAVFIICVSTLLVAENSTITQITLLHTNDSHGHVLPMDLANQKQVAGMAARMTYIKKVRRELADRGHLLLVDGGDLNTGDPFSDMLQAAPDIKIMNMMGYHAIALGNHEFDLKLEDLQRQEQAANFAYLSANVIYRKTGKLLFKPWIIEKVGNINVGIFGITTDETPLISTHGNDPRIIFQKCEQVIPQVIKTLRPQVDFLVAIMHVAHERVVQLATKFPGIDVIIGAHTHIVTTKPIVIGKTIIAEAGNYGLLVGRFDFKFENKILKFWQHNNIGINLTHPLPNKKRDGIACYPYKEQFAFDKEVEQVLLPYREKVEKLLNQPVGIATANILSGARCAQPVSSPLGNLITDAFRYHARVDIALHNVGGIRADLLQGEITYRDIKTILPFANTLYIYKATGKQVLQILSAMAQRNPLEGGFFEVSGIEFVIAANKVIAAKVNGKPLRKDKIYTLTVNSFIAKGGDGYQLFKQLTEKIDTGFLLADILIQYIKQNTPISPLTSPRFRWLTEQPKTATH